MEKRFYFRNSKTLDLCEVVAEDSDQALVLCLEETGWDFTRIVYEGSLPPRLTDKPTGKETDHGKGE